MDAAVLPAVEGVQPLQPERRDVVRRVVDERDTHLGILCGWSRSPSDVAGGSSRHSLLRARILASEVVQFETTHAEG